MRAILWISDESWEATVDAARGLLPDSAQVTLLYVIDAETSEVAHGAFAGLMGRGRHEADPGTVVDEDLQRAADALLERAAERLDRPSERQILSGWRVEHEVVDFCSDADLLILARDGDATHAGPKSLGRAGRFVVDHAPCQVLLVWPVPRSEISTHRPRPHPPRPHPPPHHQHEHGPPDHTH